MLKSCSKDQWKDAEKFVERFWTIGRGFGWGWQSPATPTAELVALVAGWHTGPTPLSPRLPPAPCTPRHTFFHGQIFFGSNKIWDEPWRSLVTGGMEVGVQRSQNPQYYGVWRTVVGQKCPVREVQWAGGVHPQGVRRGLQQGVVQGRSREVQGSWRGERRGCPPAATYHRFFIPHCTLVTNFQALIFAAKLLRIPDPRSATCHLTLQDSLISSMFHGLYAIFSYTKFCK